MIISILQIMNPMYAVCNITNAAQSTRLLASTTLRSRFSSQENIVSNFSWDQRFIIQVHFKHWLLQECIGNKNTSGDLERQRGDCSGGENQIMICVCWFENIPMGDTDLIFPGDPFSLGCSHRWVGNPCGESWGFWETLLPKYLLRLLAWIGDLKQPVDESFFERCLPTIYVSLIHCGRSHPEIPVMF